MWRVALVPCLLATSVTYSLAEESAPLVQVASFPDNCPSPEWFLLRVESHLPEGAPANAPPITATVALRGQQHHGEIRWLDKQAGRSRVFAPNKDCRELLATMALAIAIAVDPLRARTEPLEDDDDFAADEGPSKQDVPVEKQFSQPEVNDNTTESIVKDAEPVPIEKTPPIAIREEPGFRLQIGGDLFGALGMSPGAVAGGSVRLDLLTGDYLIGASASYYSPAQVQVGGASIKSSVRTIQLRTCTVGERLTPCIGASVGITTTAGEEGIEGAQTKRTPYLGLGPDLLVTMVDWESFSLSLAVQGRLNLVSTEIELGNRQVLSGQRFAIINGIQATWAF